MDITMITPVWSPQGGLRALLWHGQARAAESEDCLIELWHEDAPAVRDWPAAAGELPDRAAVRFDARAMPTDAVAVVPGLRQAGHPIWIDHVDDAEALERVGALAPEAVFGLFWRAGSGKPSSSADHATLLRLLNLLNADAENKDIEHILASSPHLLFSLLRLVNSVGVGGGRQRIAGIGHAITMLGRRQLQRWVMLLLYAERYDSGDMFTPLLVMTCVRARLMENLCRQVDGPLRRQSDTAFMIGMLSLLDQVLAEPMATLLGRVSLPESGEAALLRGEGPFAPLLAGVRAGEDGEAAGVADALAALGLTPADWSEQSWAAWCWLDRLRREG